MTNNKEIAITTVVEWIIFLNGLITARGCNPIPFSENELYVIVSMVFTVGAFLYAMWKNHNFTKASKESQQYLNILKAHLKDGELGGDEDAE